MDPNLIPDNPYLLLTPGPLSTSKGVRAALLRDWCTWDKDYNDLVQQIRAQVAAIATAEPGYTCTLMQGSGSFGVESMVGSVIPEGGKLLVLANGAYGQRIAAMGRRLRIDTVVHDSGEVSPPDLERLDRTLGADGAITHVAVVHCETTTGMLNPVAEVGRVVRTHGRVLLLDAMSSFGGIPLDQASLGADFVVSSANKCLQGVPGFAFVVARRECMEALAGQARSLCLDLYDQWRTMETDGGKWRYTSPTHVVRAFAEALREFHGEGGVEARHRRYAENHRLLVEGMEALGFSCLLPAPVRSPIITSFLSPKHSQYEFSRFYQLLKHNGFVIYPGKVTGADTFRIGTIGHVFPVDVERLLAAVAASRYWV